MATLLLLAVLLVVPAANSYRTWDCDNQKCIKGSTENAKDAVSLRECKLTCLQYGGLWPKPTGEIVTSKTLVTINPETAIFRNGKISAEAESVLMKMQMNFLQNIREVNIPYPQKNKLRAEDDVVYDLNITTNVADLSVTRFVEFADESYSLQVGPVQEGSNVLPVLINATTVLGANYGYTTLWQLVAYDDLRGRHRIVQEAKLTDKPVFTHRGISLDTARSYMPPETLKAVIRNMGKNKLNTFHWHITDTHSFPYVSKAYPQLSEAGAYSDTAVYNQSVISEIVEMARGYGVRVVPEFDAPAHVGEGWSALGEDLVTCFKWEPWTKYCVEPPCGQFDPTNDKVYEILGTIFKEYVDLFQSDLFHMGGDEVNLNCWKSTPRIVEWMTARNMSITDDGFVELWSMYQNKSEAQLRASKPTGKSILWSSTLTEEKYVDKYLNPDEYIIQIWSKKDDSNIKNLLQRNFSIFFSNYDELYLDCGGSGSWIGGPGSNWCAPYVGWQAVYRHSPYQIVQNLGLQLTDDVKNLVLGSEAALWAEQVDGNTVQERLWPRAAALAERLWSNPSEDWSEALYRMNSHRERHEGGALLQPAWCYQNDGFCGTGA